ncbi:hypothetical protein WR25_24873 isoform B [Diploscapter pachys]|uniref:Nipped-B protein n=1 Tax=Diploscapter pachys TaxID=2018661 RepID=A0A2A2L4A7_9BILA|nr:hypothetical protein WR25_24873 isoform B [Diploscapter pachys]
MDPHQLQNNMNMGMGNQINQMGASGSGVSGTPVGQYNPQMLIQQPYLNFTPFNVNYANNQQMLDFQQQQYLMMQTQAAQQIQPIFQQQAQTQHQQQQTMQQQLLNPQLSMGNSVFVQPQVQQQQQAQLTHQQRLLEEQRRQMEERRYRQQQEQLLQQQREDLLRAQAREQEEQRRLLELREREEREKLEQLRLAQEAARLAEQQRLEAEEQRRREEAERIRQEQLSKIVEEQRRKHAQAEQAHREMMDRLSIVGNPLTLVATHSMTNYLNLLPFPNEDMSLSKIPCVSRDDVQTAALLANTDKDVVQAICNALMQVDVDDIHTKLDRFHEGERETNDIYLDQMPALIKAVVNCSTNALDVDSHAMELLENEDQIVQEDLGPGPSRHLMLPTTNLEHGPTTSAAVGHDEYGTPTPPQLDPNTNQPRDPTRMSQLTQQMVSVGKQPKATPQRKKKDMVESLFDSLTDYFDPSEGRRKRMKTKTLEEEQAEKRDLELIAEMELRSTNVEGSSSEGHMVGYADEGTNSDGEQNKFYEKKEKRKRKRDDSTHDRPPTPTEVIHRRDIEWNERQKRRMEKRKKVKRNDDSDSECWNNEVLAENDSLTRFTSLVEQILDQIEDLDVLTLVNKVKAEGEFDEDDDVGTELLIEKGILEDLRCEAVKLKGWSKLNRARKLINELVVMNSELQVPTDRLMKLMTIMERNMRDVLTADGTHLKVPPLFDEDDDDDSTLRELVEDRLGRAIAAACIAMIIVTSYKMPKQVFNEDAIERAINIGRQYLNHVIFPASDSLFRAMNSKKKTIDEGKRRRKIGSNNRSPAIQSVYMRVAELFGCFSELIRMQPLTETCIHQLSTMAIASFFVSNVGELQIQTMRLATNIFSRHDEAIRLSILNDILNSLHKLPQVKNRDNSYRVGPDQWISNTTILVLQLVQSVVKMPKNKRKNTEEEHLEDPSSKVEPDTIVRESFRETQKLIGVFLSGFLNKCSIKGNKMDGEEDYRRLFDGFLQDLLLALYKPEWPASEMMLTILGSLLVKHYRSKQADITLRQACLDYLGSITARLRKDLKLATEDSDKRLELVVKTLLFEEQTEEMHYESVEDVQLDDMSNTKQRQKLEQALIDYLIYMKGEDDECIEYSVMFYAGEWYKETAEDLDIAKQEYQDKKKNPELTEKELRKLEKKMERMTEKGEEMKQFLVNLVDKKSMRKRIANMKKLGNVMLESDVNWAVKFLASRREFSHSFDQYLKQILYGVAIETTVSLRTKAMRCLTQIIEADHEVLRMEDVQGAVHHRMVDPNAAVREATLELLGKFIVAREQYIQDYYSILLERIKDTGTAVRKRVIRIIREICEKYPNYEKIPEMLARIVRRISDEEGVKKLVIDTFNGLWFQPISERNPTELLKRVITITRMVQVCKTEQNIEFLEQLMHSLLKQNERGVLTASRQIVDSLFDNIMYLEQKMARGWT